MSPQVLHVCALPICWSQLSKDALPPPSSLICNCTRLWPLSIPPIPPSFTWYQHPTFQTPHVPPSTNREGREGKVEWRENEQDTAFACKLLWKWEGPEIVLRWTGCVFCFVLKLARILAHKFVPKFYFKLLARKDQQQEKEKSVKRLLG